MPAISFMGMSSGLPPNIVEQIIAAERQPIKTLEGQKGKSENRLKLVTDLETKLNGVRDSIGTLASTKGFSDIKLNSGDPNIVQGVVDPQHSVSGSWNVEALELAQKAAAVTNGFPDKDHTQIGVGYFRFKTPEGSKEVYVDKDSSTLQGVANAINRSQVGVKASIINDRKDPDNPFRLIISGDAVGTDNKVEYPTLYFLDGDQDIYFDEERAAKNGRVKVDGFEFEISDNTVKDVIPGVTLEIKQAAPGRSVNVTVKEDQQVVSGKVQEFVKAMNDVLKFIQSQNALNGESDTTSTLGGDSLLRSIESRLRRLVQDPQHGVPGEVKRLNQLGIAYNRNGTLDFDQEKFNSTLAKNPTAVQMFFAGDGFNVGFIPTLKRDIQTVLDTGFGPLANRKRALQDKIKNIDQRIDNKEKQLSRREVELRNKFSNLEQTMARLKGQGSALQGMGAATGGGMLGLG